MQVIYNDCHSLNASFPLKAATTNNQLHAVLQTLFARIFIYITNVQFHGQQKRVYSSS